MTEFLYVIYLGKLWKESFFCKHQHFYVCTKVQKIAEKNSLKMKNNWLVILHLEAYEYILDYFRVPGICHNRFVFDM